MEDSCHLPRLQLDYDMILLGWDTGRQRTITRRSDIINKSD